VDKMPARDTSGKMKLDLAPFFFAVIAVIVKHEIFFVFLAGPRQRRIGFHIDLPKQIPEGSVAERRQRDANKPARCLLSFSSLWRHPRSPALGRFAKGTPYAASLAWFPGFCPLFVSLRQRSRAHPAKKWCRQIDFVRRAPEPFDRE